MKNDVRTLKSIIGRMPLTLTMCEMFLLHAAMLTAIGKITIDDWSYLAHLVAYRTTTRCGANDGEKEIVAKVMQQIEEQKNELGPAFN